MERYKITREEYHNELGLGNGPKFYVKELKPFLLFWKRWTFIQHRYCGYADCYMERTQFKSVHDAKKFIKNILCTGLERDSYSNMNMGEFDCNSINDNKY